MESMRQKVNLGSPLNSSVAEVFVQVLGPIGIGV